MRMHFNNSVSSSKEDSLRVCDHIIFMTDSSPMQAIFGRGKFVWCLGTCLTRQKANFNPMKLFTQMIQEIPETSVLCKLSIEDYGQGLGLEPDLMRYVQNEVSQWGYNRSNNLCLSLT